MRALELQKLKALGFESNNKKGPSWERQKVLMALSDTRIEILVTELACTISHVPINPSLLRTLCF